MILDIFPAGGLTSSVITTVWVGVFIVVMLNLRFGTTLSGLVIPGYLVPIFFIKPISAGVVIVEGVVTYFVTLFIAQFAMKRFGYSELFGRDRFFALIVVSVLVRIFFDHWALPNVGEWLTSHGIVFDYRNHLQSFGLIIVSLIANQLWNGGFKSGISVLALYLFLTFAVINYLLIPYTNFNIAEVGYMYESLAQSLLASPKAYIILITTAFIASRMNLFYGWEFSGILIPSLLALQWYQPEKLLFTFIETLIILLLGHAITRLPLMRNTSFEGARLFLLFFNIAFFYKLVLGFALIEFYPTFKVTDFYGFGYLISTLLAIKMYQKDIAIQMTRATLQTSLIAVFAASFIGFALTFTSSFESQEAPEQNNQVTTMTQQPLQKLYSDYRPTFFQSSIASYYPPAHNEQEVFVEALTLIKSYQAQKQAFLLEQATELLSRIDYNVMLVQEQYLLLSEQQSQRGWGMYIFNLHAQNKLVIQVPDGLTEKHTDSAALRLFEHFQASAIAISTSKRKRATNGSSDVLNYPVSLFQAFHNTIANNNVLQVRGYTSELKRQLLGQRQLEQDESQIKNILWTKNRLPEDLQLTQIESWLQQLDVHFTPPPFVNLQRTNAAFGFAEMMLTEKSVKRILADVIATNDITELAYAQKIEGYLQSWLLNNKSMIARKGSESYQAPELSELLFWDEEIITPLLDLSDNFKAQQWSNENQQELKRLGAIVSAYNYQLTRYIEKGQPDEYLILSELPSQDMRHWGTFIIRLTTSKNYFIEVPHPLFEASTFEFASAWFSQLKGKYLLLSGSHPFANKSELANMSKPKNTQTIFQLIHQVVQRHNNNTELLPVQIRSFQVKPNAAYPKEDIQLSFWQSIGVPSSPASANQLFEKLSQAGLSISLFDGSKEASFYDAGFSQQAHYSQVSKSGAFASVWLSPQIKHRYKQKNERSALANHTKALGIESHHVDVKSWLVEQVPSQRGLSDNIIAQLVSYQEQQDILELRQVIKQLSLYQVKVLFDSDSKQEFILILDQNNAWVALFNPNAINARTISFDNANSVATFINQRNNFLLVGE